MVLCPIADKQEESTTSTGSAPTPAKAKQFPNIKIRIWIFPKCNGLFLGALSNVPTSFTVICIFRCNPLTNKSAKKHHFLSK